MEAPVIGGIVSGGIGLLGNIATTAINSAFTKKQFEREVAQEQRTYERNRADYLADLESERRYNSPQQQINRIKEAGLNPNLLSGGALSTGQSSSATPMSNGFSPSVNPVTAPNFGDSISSAVSNISSGIAASSNADVNLRKSEAEIANLKEDWRSKKIAADFAKREHEMALNKTRAEVNEIISREQKNLSDISVNNSVIKLNGVKVNLVNKQAKLADQEFQLAIAKTTLANLDADKARKLLPYVEARAEAEYMLMHAQTDLAKEQANLAFNNSELAFVQALRENALLDQGQVDAILAKLRNEGVHISQQTEYLLKQTENYEYDMKTRRRSANASTLQGIAGIVIGLSSGAKSAYDIYNGLPSPRPHVGF